MILKPGEKVHVIHRRHYEKDHHRHFIGVVEGYDFGVARITGNVYTVDPVKFAFMKRPEVREFARAQKAPLTGGEPKLQSESIRAEHAYWDQAARVANFEPE